MKIGILTQPLRTNYGGILQNYALQSILKSLGHEAFTIDHGYQSVSSLHMNLAYIRHFIFNVRNLSTYTPPRYILNSAEDAVIREGTIRFIEKYIRLTDKCHGSEQYAAAIDKYKLDAIIVGSDQVWRPLYNNIQNMFLDFTQGINIKRIAYAASFGTDKWEFTEDQTQICSRLVQDFDLVSVREDSGLSLCSSKLNVNAHHVLDPTMLLTKEDYMHVINENNLSPSPGNLFNYILDPNNEIEMFINDMVEKYDFKPFQILPKFSEDHRTRKDVKKRIDDCVYPSPISWIRAFHDSEMIVVDSFHGMVFSIIFNKPFWVVGNKERGMSRFSSLLNMLGLQDRLLTYDELGNVDIFKPIDWQTVNDIIKKERLSSIKLITNSLL